MEITKETWKILDKKSDDLYGSINDILSNTDKEKDLELIELAKTQALHLHFRLRMLHETITGENNG